MKKVLFEGAGTAIVTPFTDEGVNYDEFKKLIEFQIDEGIDAIIVCGTTGEASTMSDDEKKDVIKFVVNTVDKRVPIIAGTGSNSTKHSIELSKYAEEIGADGLLLVTPYYNKTTQKGLIEHYKIIANSTKLPIILYNVPSRTSMNINPETYYELSKITNIVATKEASGDISQIAETARLCGEDLMIYSGNDDQILPILSLGGIGVISVLSNILPYETSSMVKYYLFKDFDNALKLQLKLLPLIKALFSETNPIPIKAALNMLGYDIGTPRLPLIEISSSSIENLKKELINYNLLNK